LLLGPKDTKSAYLLDIVFEVGDKGKEKIKHRRANSKNLSKNDKISANIEKEIRSGY
jgi:hypothetical protein